VVRFTGFGGCELAWAGAGDCRQSLADNGRGGTHDGARARAICDDRAARIRTDDGAVIVVDNRGIIVPPPAAAGGGAAAPAAAYVRTSPRFHAPQGKYDWLNETVFIGTITPATGGAVTIRAFRVR
jgi:Protein of unknown function (DUF3237)